MSQLPLFLPNAPSQAERLYTLLQDGKPHRTDEIVSLVYSSRMSLSRVAARIYDLKKKYAIEIDGWRDQNNPALYWYSLKGKPNNDYCD